MMMSYMRYFTIGCFIFMVNCKPSGNSQEKMIREQEALEELKREMYVIHDEVMPEVATIERLKRCTDKLIKTFPEDPQIAALETSKKGLEGARKVMFDWMHRVHAIDQSTDSFEERKKQLLIEKEKIVMVKDSMLNSISTAQKLLAPYETDCSRQ